MPSYPSARIPSSPDNRRPERAPSVGDPVPLSRNEVMDLIVYLIRCGGADTTEFTDALGRPDLRAADCFALDVSMRLGVFGGHHISIEIDRHRVRICAQLPSFA